MTISAHTALAEVVLPNGTLVPLNVKDYSATLDEGWVPYGQADLVCSIPPGVDALDPRKRLRVRLALEQRFGSSKPLSALSATFTSTQTLAALTTRYAGRTLASLSADYGAPFNGAPMDPTSRTFDLLLRARKVDHNAGTVTLTLTTDESLLQDYRLMATSPLNLTLTSTRAVVLAVLGRIGATLQPGTSDRKIATSAAIWSPGQTAYDFLEPLLTAAGLKLWCDENRLWRLGPPLSPADVPGMVALNSILTKAEDELSVDGEWYDGVIVKYAYKDYLGGEYLYYDLAGDKPTRPLLVESSNYYPGPGAAAAILKSVQNKGRAVRSVAVSRYDASPGMAMRLDLDGIPIQIGVVSGVEWNAGHEMTVKSRDLTDTSTRAWMFATGAWNSVPVGTDWTEY